MDAEGGRPTTARDFLLATIAAMVAPEDRVAVTDQAVAQLGEPSEPEPETEFIGPRLHCATCTADMNAELERLRRGDPDALTQLTQIINEANSAWAWSQRRSK